MKRSRMVAELREHLLKYASDDYICPDEILTLVEIHGMQPPEVFKNLGTGSCLCSMREGCWNCGGYESKWEPEEDLEIFPDGVK